MASLSAYSVGEATWPMPLALLALLVVSYLTRPASRRVTSGQKVPVDS
jgi:hypothetical protein